MQPDYVQKVVELACPFHPVEQPDREDWERVEHELGLLLPQDYKLLVGAIGSGAFGVGLSLRNPVSSSEYARLSAADLSRYRQGIVFLEERIGLALFPRAQGLVHIGGIDRQHFLYRPKQSSRKPSCLVNLDHEYEVTRDLDLSLSQLIHDLYTGKLQNDWAHQLRASIWVDQRTPFFTSRAGQSPNLTKR